MMANVDRVLKPKSQSFTCTYSGISNALFTEIFIGRPLPPNFPISQSDLDTFIKHRAIWDTGASGTVITTEIVKILNLAPIDKTNVTGIHGTQTANVYLISIGLPNNMVVGPLRATEVADLSGGYGCLIGMDIIATGDFAVTNHSGSTVMSFRIPSIAHIDFVKEHGSNPNNFDGLNRAQRREMERVSQKKKKR